MTDDTLRAALETEWLNGNISSAAYERILAASATDEGPNDDMGHDCSPECNVCRDKPKYGGANCPIGFCTATEICPHRPAVPALDVVRLAKAIEGPQRFAESQRFYNAGYEAGQRAITDAMLLWLDTSDDRGDNEFAWKSAVRAALHDEEVHAAMLSHLAARKEPTE